MLYSQIVNQNKITFPLIASCKVFDPSVKKSKEYSQQIFLSTYYMSWGDVGSILCSLSGGRKMAPGIGRCSGESYSMGSFIQMVPTEEQATVHISSSGFANRTFNKPGPFPMRNSKIYHGILKVQNYYPFWSSAH